LKELVVISGKGGTGKTSIVASFAALSQKAVLADCDVDAADLYLILEPSIQQRGTFLGGKVSTIRQELCTGCGICPDLCRFDAIEKNSNFTNNGELFSIDPIACEGCGVCVYFCPENAIDLEDKVAGEWFISETRFGPMVHARLGIAAENSGKLVTLVRRNAQRIADERGLSLIIVDGSPGTGCPVISSVTGASLVLVVTEPTMSGQHDLARVAELADHFKIPTVICVNKWDLNPSMSSSIEDWADGRGIEVVGKIRYDPAVTKAMIEKRSIVEYSNGEIAQEIAAMWGLVTDRISQ